MDHYFGYIRVSTAKQGEHGVSLPEQREAIERYVQRNGLAIVNWFEERETAAKRGRPIFGQMLNRLKRGQAKGVVIHKIDRSARNLKDWADLGELIDQGIEVHFANESLDLHSRGGRLSADIQAVVASDFIRNLREETRKGFYGRLKQGLYPLPAPLGYLNRGKGQPKILDEQKAPLVRQAFELYSSGRFPLQALMKEMDRLGLRNRKGGKVTINGLSTLLNNPFYMGLIYIQRTGETFAGIHAPLISKSLFDRVQATLRGKTNSRTIRHDFTFRRLLACESCGYHLIGEQQKGHVYYRCHTKGCLVRSIREETVEEAVRQTLAPLTLDPAERTYLQRKVAAMNVNWVEEKKTHQQALKLQLAQANERLNRLTDAFLDQSIDKEFFQERKALLLQERLALQEQLAGQPADGASGPDRLAQFLELASSLILQYELANPPEKREILKNATSNCVVGPKNVAVTLSIPLQAIAERHKNEYGDPYRYRPRTLDTLLQKIEHFFHGKKTSAASRAHPLQNH